MAVNVVNSYPAEREKVPVNFVSNVLLPTEDKNNINKNNTVVTTRKPEGNPTNPTRVSPDLLTSNPRWSYNYQGPFGQVQLLSITSPEPPPPPFLPDESSVSSLRSFESFAFTKPKWPSVALFF